MSRQQHKYRRIFIQANGPGPWPCYAEDCDEPVLMEDLDVHHFDEDHENNDPTNLTAMHHACHSRHHRLGKRLSDDARRKVSDAHRGKPLSAEHRQRISDVKRGQTLSAEHKQKIRDAQRGRTLSAEHKSKISEGLRSWYAKKG